MSEPFDHEKYERLQGMKLGVYALEVAKDGQLPPNCLEYVKTNAARWDGQHLEMGLLFLSKLDSVEARHEIVNYIDHPLKHIRYSVLMLVDRMPVDRFIFEKLRVRCTVDLDDFEKSWVESLHRKFSKELG